MDTRNTRIAAAAMTALLLVAIGCQRRPAEPLPPGDEPTIGSQLMGDPVDNGEIAYALYCVSCHGEGGRGDGPVASALTKPPADLTRMTVKYGGVFPAAEIYEYVDGRRDVAAHGTRQMPVWGNIWTDTEMGEDGEVQADIRLRELVEYIRSIQEPM